MKWTNPHGTLVVDEDYHSVALVSSFHSDAKLNMRLIAKAPELLKIAKALFGRDYSEDVFSIILDFDVRELIKEIEG